MHFKNEKTKSVRYLSLNYVISNKNKTVVMECYDGLQIIYYYT